MGRTCELYKLNPNARSLSRPVIAILSWLVLSSICSGLYHLEAQTKRPAETCGWLTISSVAEDYSWSWRWWVYLAFDGGGWTQEHTTRRRYGLLETSFRNSDCFVKLVVIMTGISLVRKRGERAIWLWRIARLCLSGGSIDVEIGFIRLPPWRHHL